MPDNMTDRDKVIKGLETVWNGMNAVEHELYADYVYDALDLLKDDETQLQYRSDIIYEEERETARLRKLLKEQEPRVLTLEEVLKANPVWFETHGLLLPAIIDHEESKAGDCVIVFGEFDGSYYPINRYNKKWRCWTARPTDGQRTEVKWE